MLTPQVSGRDSAHASCFRSRLALAAAVLAALGLPPGALGGHSALEPEHPLSEPELTKAPGSQEAPDVAWNGELHVAVWNDGRGGVYATRIDRDGRSLDPLGFRISGGPSPTVGRANPALASDGSGFLVVWEEYRPGTFEQDIVGVRLSRDGRLVDTQPIQIAATARTERWPALTWTGSRYLVSWTDQEGIGPYSVHMSLVGTDGATSSATFLRTGLSPNMPGRTATATSGTTSLVAWTTAQGVEAVRVDATGALIGPGPFSVSRTLDDDRLAVAGSDHGFLVVGTTSRFPQPETRGVRVTTAGVVLDPEGLLLSDQSYGSINPDVAANGQTFLVCWTPSSPRCVRVGWQAGRLDGAPVALPVAGTGEGDLTVAIAAYGEGYLVVWGRNDVYSARVGADGAPLDAEAGLLSQAAVAQHHVDLVWNGEIYFAVWADAFGDIRAARLTAEGRSLDGAGIRLATGVRRQEPAVAWNGETFFVVWKDHREHPFDAALYGARVTRDGAVLEPNGVRISAPLNAATPDVASDGRNFLVVWSETGWNTGYDVRAARVDPAGGLLDAEGVRVATGPYNDVSPSVAWNGSSFLVAWSGGHAAFQDGELLAARLSPTGTLIDSAPLTVAATPEDEIDPVVAWGAGSHLVVWSAGNDVFARRVTSGGTLADTAAIDVAVGPAWTGSPALAFDGGDFLVAWQTSTVAGWSIEGRRVAASGGSTGAAFSALSGIEYEPWPAVAGGLGAGSWIAYERVAREPLYGGSARTFIRPFAAAPQPQPPPPVPPAPPPSPPQPPSPPAPPSPPQPVDVKGPAVRALAARARTGGLARLSYRVSDEAGQTRERVRIWRGRRVVKTIWTGSPPRTNGDLSSVTWRAPRRPGPFRFCVVAWDSSGNASPASCAAIRVRRST